jgi:putative peptidoglycan lipid II flippase
VSAFDPAVDGGSGEENSEQARLAADDDAATAWQTDRYYNSPDLSGLKPGVGLLVDLGSPARVSEVQLSLLGAGTAVELRATPAQAAAPPDSADGFRTLARAPDAAERAVLQPAEPVTTRYLLVYLTSLPADSLGGYRGRVAEIEVFG